MNYVQNNEGLMYLHFLKREIFKLTWVNGVDKDEGILNRILNWYREEGWREEDRNRNI